MPYLLLQGSGIRSTLTPGRQNGLVNIIKTVQDSVRDSAAVGQLLRLTSHIALAGGTAHGLCLLGHVQQQQGSSTGLLPRPEPVVPLITSYDEDVSVRQRALQHRPAMAEAPPNAPGVNLQVAVLLSGGVDSSVALNLLLKQASLVLHGPQRLSTLTTNSN